MRRAMRLTTCAAELRLSYLRGVYEFASLVEFASVMLEMVWQRFQDEVCFYKAKQFLLLAVEFKTVNCRVEWRGA